MDNWRHRACRKSGSDEGEGTAGTDGRMTYDSSKALTDAHFCEAHFHISFYMDLD